MSHSKGRRLYQSHNLLFGVPLHPGSPEQIKQCCSIALSFDNNNNTINLSATTTGFIFPNDHSQQQQQQSRPRIYSDPQNPNLLLFLRHPDWKWKCGKWGITYFWRYPSGPTTPKNGFLSIDSLRWSVSDAPRKIPQRVRWLEPCRWDW